MKAYGIDRLRNVALIGHGQSGKTSLVEAALFAAGAADRLGSVEAGTSISDSDPEEIGRKSSIAAALLPVEWNGYKLNLLDTPGFADFSGEVFSALRVADAAVVVVDAASGIGVQTERYAAQAADRGLARLVVVTKLDKEHTDFVRTRRRSARAPGLERRPGRLSDRQPVGHEGRGGPRQRRRLSSRRNQRR